jgi:subtilase family serine protease
MTHTAKTLAFASLALLGVACSGMQGGASAPMPAGSFGQSSSPTQLPAFTENNYVRACPTLRPREEVLCGALIRTDVKSHAVVTGLTPADLHAAYNIPNTGGGGRIIGIADALDDPYAETDLARYRAHFKLPPCTTANGCFRKLNQTGVAAKYPSADVGWSHEISLDLDMASAICPACRIVLVEATSPTFENLGEAVDMAVAKGAETVSNSYDGEEFTRYDKHFDHKGVVIVAASGDTGFGAGPLQPASFSTVVAVGGTSLYQASGARAWSETAWSLGGAGCSRRVRKPAWQHDAGCSMRTETDVSAVADPDTGVAVYDSLGINGTPWQVFGGTSVSSPIVASLYALAGNAAAQDAAKGIWQDAGTHLFDVTAGNDGYCTPAYLCNAGPGYDAATGWGTPNGLAAF